MKNLLLVISVLFACLASQSCTKEIPTSEVPEEEVGTVILEEDQSISQDTQLTIQEKLQLSEISFPDINAAGYDMNTHDRSLTFWERDINSGILQKLPKSIYVQNNHFYIVNWRENNPNAFDLYCGATITAYRVVSDNGEQKIVNSSKEFKYHNLRRSDHPYEGRCEVVTAYVSGVYPEHVLFYPVMGKEMWIERSKLGI